MIDAMAKTWLLCLVPLTLAGGQTAAQPKKEYAQEYVQTFRENPKDFDRYGPKAEACIKFVADGLRLTLPVGHGGDITGTGLTSRFGIKGDFEITLRYDVLQEPDAEDAGSQTRFAVWVELAKPSGQDQAAINYRVTQKGGRQFFAWQSVKSEKASKPQTQMKIMPAKAKAGRLRLVRAGADMSYFAADGDEQDFVLVQTAPFGAEDVRSFSIVGATGSPKAALDVRVTELRIRAAGFPLLGPPPITLHTPPQKQYAAEHHQPLRERADSLPGFDLIGPGKEQNVQLEAAGLHITLPPGWNGERPSSGLVSQFSVKGDFEITVNFEILHEPKPADAGAAGGTRVNLAIVKETGEVTNLNRTMGMKGGRVFYAWSSTLVNPQTGKKWSVNQPFATNTMSGRLRLVRAGADLYYGAAEGDGEFKFFAKAAFGDEDIQQVRLIGATGGAKAALDARFSDLRIRADAIPGAPATPARAALLGEPPPQPRRRWLALGVLVGLTAVLLLAGVVGAWVFVRRVNKPTVVKRASPKPRD